MRLFSFVIPGRDEVANPESISTPVLRLNGFRVRANARPGMTVVADRSPPSGVCRSQRRAAGACVNFNCVIA